jgi:hypothetical protein
MRSRLFHRSNGAVLSVIDEMSSAIDDLPTPNGGCHPLWVLGHLARVEGSIPAILTGEPNPMEGWQRLFGQDSEPVADPAAYPPFAEVRDMYVRLRERNLALLASLSEADLDKPSVAPPRGLERHFATYGASFLTLALHQMLHRSHVTDARRAARVAA